MAQHTFEVTARSAASPAELFAALADAPGWPRWAGSSIKEGTWVRPGSPAPGGVGAVRRLGARPVYTTETITEYGPPERMSWTVRGLPVRDYACTVELTPDGGGTLIRWSGRYRGSGLLRPLLRRTVRGFAEGLAASRPAAAPTQR